MTKGIFIDGAREMVQWDKRDSTMYVTERQFDMLMAVDPAKITRPHQSVISSEGPMLGLYVTESLCPNRVIGFYTGKHYTTQDEFNTAKQLGERDLAPYAFTRSDGVVIDGSEGGNFTIRINDATILDTSEYGIVPNCLFVEVVVEDVIRGILIITTQMIYQGTECFINYGSNYFSNNKNSFTRTQLARDSLYYTVHDLYGYDATFTLRGAIFARHMDKVYSLLFPTEYPSSRPADLAKLVKRLLGDVCLLESCENGVKLARSYTPVVPRSFMD